LREQQRDRHHDEHRRGNALHATPVELEQRECAALDLAEDVAGDQKSRDDEENVDSDETARQKRLVEMEEDDRKNCDRAKTIDIGSIVGALRPGISHAPDGRSRRRPAFR
jgi:hypothetical protein